MPWVDDAIRACRRAAEIAEGNEIARKRRGAILGVESVALQGMGDLEGALRAVQESLSTQQHNAGVNPAAERLNLINAFLREGIILGSDEDISLGRSNEAMAAFARGLELAEKNAKSDPDDELSRSLAAYLLTQQGNILRHSDARAALALYDRALARLKEAKANPRTQHEEAETLADSSYVERRIERNGNARQRIDAALRILREAGDYPADRIKPLAEPETALRALAEDYAATGRPDKAAETYRELLAKLSAFRPGAEEDLEAANSYSRPGEGLARVLRQSGHAEEAAQFEMRRAELWKKWDRKLPHNPFVLRQMAAAPAAGPRS